MLGRDGLEGHSDPFDGPRIGPKHHFFEFCRFREVNKTRPRPV
jgi:hypothetical protein